MANLKNITELPVAESADGLNLIVNDNGVAKQIAASEVGAQADWNVTDESSPAFIKNKPVDNNVKSVNGTKPDETGNVIMDIATSWNDLTDKPFYEEETERIEILPETTLEFTATGYSGNQQIANIESLNLIDGEWYIVTWDNQEYNCQCQSYSGEAIGNCESFGGVGDIKTPFFMWNSGIVITDFVGSHTFKIEKTEIIIHQIDEKFIPKGAGVVVTEFEADDQDSENYWINSICFAETGAIPTAQEVFDAYNTGEMYISYQGVADTWVRSKVLSCSVGNGAYTFCYIYAPTYSTMELRYFVVGMDEE